MSAGSRAGKQARQVCADRGEVGVHLDDELCTSRQRLAKPCDVGGAETLLARPVKHRDVLVRRREPLGDLPGAVGRGVIDDRMRRGWLRCSRTAATIGSRLEASLYVGRTSHTLAPSSAAPVGM